MSGDAGPRRRSVALGIGAAGVLLVGALALAAVHSSGTAAPATTRPSGAGQTRIRVVGDDCAPGWIAPPAGPHTFLATNDSPLAMQIDIEETDHRPFRVFGRIPKLAPGTTRPLAVSLPAGHYVWACTASGAAPLYSAIGKVSGTAKGGSSFVPVNEPDLQAALAAAESTTKAGLAPLVADTDRLAAAIDRGDLVTGRKLWLTAHLDYERLGDAYDSFGDYADLVDGRPDGLPDGVADPGWSGFLRLEYALWHGQPAPVAKAVADRLAKDVRGLQAGFPVEHVPATTLPVRVHEILENTLQFQLTGQADQGSHTTLATARANVDGTRAALAAVAPLLKTRSPAPLATANRDLDGLAALLDSFHHPDGTWTSSADLTRAQHESLDAKTSQAVEDLAAIPDVLQPTQDTD